MNQPDSPYDFIRIPQEIRSAEDRLIPDSKRYFDFLMGQNTQIPEEVDLMFAFFHPSHSLSFQKIFLEETDLKLNKIKELDAWTTTLPNGSTVGACSLPIGSSGASTRLEILRHLNFRNLVILGFSGAPGEDHPVGEWKLIDQAICHEGSSLLYREEGVFSYPHFGLTESLEQLLVEQEIAFRKGLAWTVDNPFRIQSTAYKFWKKKQTISIDMECSAIFSLCNHHKIPAACLHVTSDQLSPDNWNLGFHSSSLKESWNQLLRWCARLPDSLPGLQTSSSY